MIETEQKRKLPTGWKWVKLGEVCNKISNGTSLLQNTLNEGFPVTRIETISFGTIDKSRMGWIDISLKKAESLKLYRGDILLSHINSVAKLGNCAIYEGEPEILIHGMNLLRIQPNLEEINAWYLLFCFRSSNAKSFYETNALRAIGQASLNIKVLSTLKIALPPLAEQKRIAKILTKKMATAAKAKKACQKKLEAAEKLHASYLNAIFNSQKAKQWPKKKLGEVCEFIGGMQPPKYTFKYEKEPDYIRLVQIQDFRINNAAVYIPKEHAKRTFNEDDVMIGRYGPPVFQILRGLSGAYNVALMKTVPKKGLLKNYLYFLLQEGNIQRAVIGQSQRSAGQSGVQKSFLENYEVCLPEKNEQKQIAGILTEQMAAAEKVKKAIEEEMELMNKLPTSLLQQAFSGKL